MTVVCEWSIPVHTDSPSTIVDVLELRYMGGSDTNEQDCNARVFDMILAKS